MTATAARDMKKTPSTLTEKMRRHASSVVAAAGARTMTPAAFTRMSTLPWAAAAASTTVEQNAESLTSPTCTSAPIVAAWDSARPAFRSTMMTLAPRPVSRAAVAAPIPEAPPVTTATRPVRSTPGRGCGRDVRSVIAPHAAAATGEEAPRFAPGSTAPARTVPCSPPASRATPS